MRSKLKLIGITAAVLAAVMLAGVFAVQGAQNKAFALEEQVGAAKSGIAVQEKRRVDLVYNLADCVKQYDSHEARTLMDVAEARGGVDAIENASTALAAISEAYPELKADGNYKELMNELSVTENLIAQYRANYNGQVKEYRRYVRGFPNRMFLELLGYEAADFEYLDYSAPSGAPQDLFGER